MAPIISTTPTKSDGWVDWWTCVHAFCGAVWFFFVSPFIGVTLLGNPSWALGASWTYFGIIWLPSALAIATIWEILERIPAFQKMLDEAEDSLEDNGFALARRKIKERYKGDVLVNSVCDVVVFCVTYAICWVIWIQNPESSLIILPLVHVPSFWLLATHMWISWENASAASTSKTCAKTGTVHLYTSPVWPLKSCDEL